LTPEQAEEEAARRVGLGVLMLAQAVMLLAVAWATPLHVGMTYGAIAGWLIAATWNSLKRPVP
jgi:hypothetical protein